MFGERRLFDVVMERRSVNPKVTESISKYLKNPDPNLVILVRDARFEWRQRRNKWFRALVSEDHAVVFIGESLRSFEIKSWITQKSRELNLSIDPSAIDQLATMNEGNLGSIHQELEQLSLLYNVTDEVITLKDIRDVDSSTSNIFDLLTRAFDGNYAAVEKLFTALQVDERNFFPLLGALLAKLRQAINLQQNNNVPISRFQRENLMGFLRRTPVNKIYDYFKECANLDSELKGIHRGSGWVNLRALLLAIAGVGDSCLDAQTRWSRIDNSQTS